ncbi:hypothetical protein GGR06_003258 [Bacteroides reticulotermitis]|uniref:Uncharacterized protein n=1 Tax=Bacteroides reticulotermitis TaxID=1133319 RepID=A0A840D7J4_9BACE|nr:hypothetical protein [Bacteroides reticulotermitis]
MKRLLLQSMRYFLPILFVSYMASITFFGHVHVVNGVVVVHSHPFKKSANHQHSTVELQLIHFLSILTVDDLPPTLSIAQFIPSLLFTLLDNCQSLSCHAPYHGVVGLRAPPAIHFL